VLRGAVDTISRLPYPRTGEHCLVCPTRNCFPLPACKAGLEPEAAKEVAACVPPGMEGSEEAVGMAISLPPPTMPAAAVIEVISACRRPADDLIKVLKTMISVAGVKQCQTVPQLVDQTEASAALAAKTFHPTTSMAPQEATLGELIAGRGGGSTKASEPISLLRGVVGAGAEKPNPKESQGEHKMSVESRSAQEPLQNRLAQLSGSEYKVLSYLYKLVVEKFHNRGVRMTDKTLSKATGVSLRQVGDVRKSLVKKRLVQTETIRGKGTIYCSPAPLATGSSPSPGVEEPIMVRHDAGEMEAKASPPPPAAITPIAKSVSKNPPSS